MSSSRTFGRRALLVGQAAPTTAELAAVAESLELAVADHHDSVADLLWSEAEQVLRSASRHHRDHAEALAALAGPAATGTANSTLVAELQPAEDDPAPTAGSVLQAVLDLEHRLANTYLRLIGMVDRGVDAGVLAGILADEAAHATRVALLIGAGVPSLFPDGPVQVADGPWFDPSSYSPS